MLRFKYDKKYFDDGMIQLEQLIRASAKRAVEEVGEQLLRDVLDAPPSCPVKEGDLYDAHKLEIRGVGRGHKAIITIKGIPYAASQHEGISRWGTPYRKYTRPGSGSHWVSSKATIYHDRYIALGNKVAKEHLRRHGKSH